MVQRKFDARHQFFGAHSASVEEGTNQFATTIPIVMNDDAQGDPMSLNVNPEHASWAIETGPNCYPDSEIRNLRIKLYVIGTSDTAAVIPFVEVEYGLISCAFPEDLDAIDEKSGLSLKEILELTKETTDRQCYPLFNNIKMIDPSTWGTEIPGMNSTTAAEATDWDSQVVHDQRTYGKLKGLLKKSLPIGIRSVRVNFHQLTGGMKTISINTIPSNAKYINPYTFLGLYVKVKQVAAAAALNPRVHLMLPNTLTTADADRVHIAWQVSFNERNPEFHMAKV